MMTGLLLFLAGMTAILLRRLLPLASGLVGVQVSGRSRVWPALTLLGVTLGLLGLVVELDGFVPAEAWLSEHFGYGDVGVSFADGSVEGKVSQPRAYASAMAVRTLPAAPANAALPSTPMPDPARPRPRILAVASADLPEFPVLSQAPELSGVGPWHNSAPLRLSDQRGKVVLVDFWSYSNVNSIRTLPYINGYWQEYRYLPFVVIGIHPPEFLFEKERDNVARAIRVQGLTYPVGQDNDLHAWLAFENLFWPVLFLIDADGSIRYMHVGEGGYADTDLAIRALLREAGVRAPFPKPPLVETPVYALPQSPRTRLGAESGDAFQNRPEPLTDEVITYRLPRDLPLHAFALDGRWQMQDGERQVLRGEQGMVQMRFTGSEISLVLGQVPGAKVPVVDVEVDGAPTGTFPVQTHDLYDLWRGPYGEHLITLRIRGAGLEAYVFEFGS